MVQLAGLSGAHGTGKTTVIDYIQNDVVYHEKMHVKIDDFKVSRTILAEMGLTLDQATATAELAMEYQTKVLQRKIDHDSRFTKYEVFGISPTWVFDRSVADIYAYTRLWTEKNGISLEWFAEFEQKCVAAMALYDIILLFPIGKFDFVDDGIRAKLETQATIAKYIEEFVVAHAKKYHVIESTSVDLRAHEILRTIKNGTKTFT